MTNTSKASHLMGGEITWECIKSGPNAGAYVFHMIVFRDCEGITLTNNETMFVENYNGTVDTSFAMTLITMEDVSPKCDTASGFWLDCGDLNSTGDGNGEGAIRKNTYYDLVVWNTSCQWMGVCVER